MSRRTKPAVDRRVADLTVGELRAELASVLAAMLTGYLDRPQATGLSAAETTLPAKRLPKRAPLRPPLRSAERASSSPRTSHPPTENSEPTELDFTKARAALERMGLLPGSLGDG